MWSFLQLIDISSSWLRKPLYRRCGNGERAAATEVARAAVDGVVGGEAGTSVVAFQLFARTHMVCSLLYHLFESSGFFSSKKIDSLLADSNACAALGRYARLLLFWLREAPSRGGTLARHSSSRSVKSSGGVFLAKQNPREAFFLTKHQALEKHISRGVHYLLARSICPLEVASGTCLAR